jgi:RNase P subunit RPR2
MFGGDGDAYMPVCGRGDQGCSVYVANTATVYMDDMADNIDTRFSIVAPTTYKGKFITECSTPLMNANTANTSF